MPKHRAKKPLWRCPVLTTGQIAKLFQVCSTTVARWIDDGLLPGLRVPGSKHRRVLRSAVLKFAAEHGVPCEALLDPDPVTAMEMAAAVGALAKERP